MASLPRLPVLVSACLMGQRCRYDGRENRSEDLLREIEERGERALPFCPEEAGGLPTPRPPAWLAGSAAEVLSGRARVLTEAGADVTAEFLAGARKALHEAQGAGVRRAYLKERSPSCGVANTHRNGECVPGPGVSAALLAQHGIDVQGR